MVRVTLVPAIVLGQLLLMLIIYLSFVRNYQKCPEILPPLASKCELSLFESDGYICESDAVWNERKRTYHIQDDENMIPHNSSFFFLDNWTQDFHCSNSRRIGSPGEGGKWVCDPYRLKSYPNCLVYSAGSNGEFSFEIEMKNSMPHCEIHTFDTDFHKSPKNVCTFHTLKLGNGAEGSYSKNWTAILHELNHTKRAVDIFKIDIEGGEYEFFPLIFASDQSTFPRQILVELHPTNNFDVHAFFRMLRKNGYVIFSKEQNLLAGQYYFEYSFLKLNKRFFVRS